MKNKLIGASAMFALLNIPALFGYIIGVVYCKAYLIAFITTITVMVVNAIIEYLKNVFKK
jgi:hypothetical protein